MKFLAIAIAIALFFFLSISSARTSNLNVSQKEFVPFDKYKIENQDTKAGSIINVPIQCPSNKIRVGNRCRTVFQNL